MLLVFLQHKEAPHLEGLTVASQIKEHREARIEYFPWFILIISVVRNRLVTSTH